MENEQDHIGTFGDMSYEQFAKNGKSFFDRLKEDATTAEQAEAGLKALTIMYLSLKGTELEEYNASMVIEIATKKMIERFPEIAV